MNKHNIFIWMPLSNLYSLSAEKNTSSSPSTSVVTITFNDYGWNVLEVLGSVLTLTHFGMSDHGPNHLRETLLSEPGVWMLLYLPVSKGCRGLSTSEYVRDAVMKFTWSSWSCFWSYARFSMSVVIRRSKAVQSSSYKSSSEHVIVRRLWGWCVLVILTPRWRYFQFFVECPQKHQPSLFQRYASLRMFLLKICTLGVRFDRILELSNCSAHRRISVTSLPSRITGLALKL